MDEKERGLYLTVLIIALVLGIIILYFIISIIRQQRRSLRLYRQSLETEITTLERERKRMAADLHDEIGPVLSAVKLRLNSLDLSNEEDEAEVEATNAQIDRLMKRMREISFDLMPSSLQRKGLPAAIQEFIEYCSRNNSGLSISFRVEEGLQFSEEQGINLYRIVQEVIHNTVKHAGATQLQMELRREKEVYVMATRDNGKGFEFESRSREGSGQGLQNMLNRCGLLGGKMFVESEKGKGTTYIFEIPTPYNAGKQPDKNPAS